MVKRRKEARKAEEIVKKEAQEFEEKMKKTGWNQSYAGV
jgi:glutamyl-tRNA reductase